MESSEEKLSKRDAGIIGSKKAAIVNKQRYEERIEKYNQNPKRCLKCDKPISYESRRNKFCSKSCATSYNNKTKEGKLKQCKKCGKEFLSFSANGKYCKDCHNTSSENKKSPNEIKGVNVPKWKKMYPEHNCLYCNKIIPAGRSSKFCDRQCDALYKWDKKKEEIIKQGHFDCSKGSITAGETNRNQVKRFLLDRDGHKCSICGLSEWMGKPIPLIADHIDGNTQNHNIDNFRLICGNCDMQLPTYKSRNYSRGREYRKKYNKN